MNTVEKEMKEHRPVFVREIVVNVEQEAMEAVFEDCPYDVSGEKTNHSRGEGSECGSG